LPPTPVKLAPSQLLLLLRPRIAIGVAVSHSGDGDGGGGDGSGGDGGDTGSGNEGAMLPGATTTMTMTTTTPMLNIDASGFYGAVALPARLRHSIANAANKDGINADDDGDNKNNNRDDDNDDDIDDNDDDLDNDDDWEFMRAHMSDDSDAEDSDDNDAPLRWHISTSMMTSSSSSSSSKSSLSSAMTTSSSASVSSASLPNGQFLAVTVAMSPATTVASNVTSVAPVALSLSIRVRERGVSGGGHGDNIGDDGDSGADVCSGGSGSIRFAQSLRRLRLPPLHTGKSHTVRIPFVLTAAATDAVDADSGDDFVGSDVGSVFEIAVAVRRRYTPEQRRQRRKNGHVVTWLGLPAPVIARTMVVATDTSVVTS
jgi:hypothetical protein